MYVFIAYISKIYQNRHFCLESYFFLSFAPYLIVILTFSPSLYICTVKYTLWFKECHPLGRAMKEPTTPNELTSQPLGPTSRSQASSLCKRPCWNSIANKHVERSHKFVWSEWFSYFRLSSIYIYIRIFIYNIQQMSWNFVVWTQNQM